MYASIFNSSGTPYYLTTTPDLGDYYSANKINTMALGRGRAGTIFKDEAEFYLLLEIFL